LACDRRTSGGPNGHGVPRHLHTAGDEGGQLLPSGSRRGGARHVWIRWQSLRGHPFLDTGSPQIGMVIRQEGGLRPVLLELP